MRKQPATSSHRSTSRKRVRPARLDVTISADVGAAFVSPLAGNLPKAHQLLPHTAVRGLSVALVGDRRMSLLHQQFMGISGPTDVLTFPLETDSRGRVTSGEIIICIPEARRQASRRRIPVANEVLLYALHGLLHLSGFDDRTQSQYQQMHRTEDNILTRLGFGPVFTAEPPKASTSARRITRTA